MEVFKMSRINTGQKLKRGNKLVKLGWKAKIFFKLKRIQARLKRLERQVMK